MTEPDLVEVNEFHAKWQGVGKPDMVEVNEFMQNGKGLTLLFDRKQDLIEVGDFHAKWQGVNLTFCMENRT